MLSSSYSESDNVSVASSASAMMCKFKIPDTWSMFEPQGHGLFHNNHLSPGIAFVLLYYFMECINKPTEEE